MRTSPASLELQDALLAEALDVHRAARGEVLEELELLAGAAGAVRAAAEDGVLGALTIGVSHEGQRSGGPVAGPRSSRSTACGAGESTCGMTSPARRTMTSSPTRRSLRATSSSLWSVASFTVTPPTWTGSSTANGCRSPNLPTFHVDVLQQRDRGRRRELPRDRPARVAPDDAEAALQLDVVDLDHDAVDLEVERAAALLPAPGSGRRPRPRRRGARCRRSRGSRARAATRARPSGSSNAMPSVAPTP